MSDAPDGKSADSLLHPRDQTVLAVLCAVGFLGIAAFLWSHFRGERGLIDIDESPRYANEFVVNINEADWPELATLPGVGPKLAQEILRYRKQHGPFQTLEQIQNVPGIGAGKLRQFQMFLLELPNADSAKSVTPIE